MVEVSLSLIGPDVTKISPKIRFHLDIGRTLVNHFSLSTVYKRIYILPTKVWDLTGMSVLCRCTILDKMAVYVHDNLDFCYVS